MSAVSLKLKHFKEEKKKTYCHVANNNEKKKHTGPNTTDFFNLIKGSFCFENLCSSI